MGRINGRDCDLWLNGVFMSGDTSAFDINTSRGTLRTPQLNKRAQVRLPGLKDFELMVNIWADAGADSWWEPITSLSAKDDDTSILVLLDHTVGAWVFAAQALVSENNWQRGDDGSLAGTLKLEPFDNTAGWFRLLTPDQPKALTQLGATATIASEVALRPATPTDLLVWSPDGGLTLDEVHDTDFILNTYTGNGFLTPGSAGVHNGFDQAIKGGGELGFIKDYSFPAGTAPRNTRCRLSRLQTGGKETYRWLVAEGIAWD